MQLKFRVILNVEEDVLRDIITDSNITLIEFSKIISSEFGFDSSEISTFHHSNENWEQLDEIKINIEIFFGILIGFTGLDIAKIENKMNKRTIAINI